MAKSNNKNIKKKTHIPKPLRTNVWEKYSGKNYESNCFICNKIITINSWDCGFIIPESKGGKIILENLMPVCKQCNKSLGDMNMYDYKKKYFPSNSSCLIC